MTDFSARSLPFAASISSLLTNPFRFGQGFRHILLHFFDDLFKLVLFDGFWIVFSFDIFLTQKNVYRRCNGIFVVLK